MTQSHPLLRFGLPPDAVAWTALFLGLCCAVAVGWPLLRGRLTAALCQRPSFTLGALALLAALLSAGYVHFYLRGGPRIIDATAYFLQARALAEGAMTFDVPAPSAAFRGRFLVSVPSTEDAQVSLGVLFPPGYPALLALGFMAEKPLWVGPLLGAALALATYGLARRLSGRRDVALLAAALSVLSAALRYHTADTMSHGWAALLFTGALWASLGPAAGRRPAPRVPWNGSARHPAFPLLAGLCAGWLLATRPLTGAVCAAGCVWLMLHSPTSRAQREASALKRALGLLPRQGLLFGAALLPGLLLLLWHQVELTGHLLGSPQLRYYQLADGPPGCFGLGLSDRLGCHHEHGDVVARFGEGGFGPLDALQNTLHRLHHHSLDFANWEPLGLLVPWALWRRRRSGEVRALAAVTLGIIAGYATFYFHGNYPGGGARFFAELLPLEHAVVAWGCAGTRWSRWLLPTALLGFGCHGSYSHQHLAEREGGRPMFEPEVVERSLPATPASAAPALVFLDTDHGFNLGFDPSPHPNPERSWFVARATSPDLDRLLWERLGRPPAYRYVRSSPTPERGTEPRIETAPHLAPLSWHHPGSSPSGAAQAQHAPGVWKPGRLETRPALPLRIEAEHDWPPLALQDAWVQPVFSALACVSGGRALALHPTGKGSSLQGELNVAAPGPHSIALGLVLPAGSEEPPQGPPQVRLVVGNNVLPLKLSARGVPPGCARFELGELDLPAVAHWKLQSAGRSVTLDYLEVTPLPAPALGPGAPKGVGHRPL